VTTHALGRPSPCDIADDEQTASVFCQHIQRNGRPLHLKKQPSMSRYSERLMRVGGLLPEALKRPTGGAALPTALCQARIGHKGTFETATKIVDNRHLTGDSSFFGESLRQLWAAAIRCWQSRGVCSHRARF
jgi:hypothetical protein